MRLRSQGDNGEGFQWDKICLDVPRLTIDPGGSDEEEVTLTDLFS